MLTVQPLNYCIIISICNLKQFIYIYKENSPEVFLNVRWQYPHKLFVWNRLYFLYILFILLWLSFDLQVTSYSSCSECLEIWSQQIYWWHGKVTAFDYGLIFLISKAQSSTGTNILRIRFLFKEKRHPGYEKLKNLLC